MGYSNIRLAWLFTEIRQKNRDHIVAFVTGVTGVVVVAFIAVVVLIAVVAGFVGQFLGKYPVKPSSIEKLFYDNNDGDDD
jgi:Na+/citrate or Na+/malate symporter